MKKHATKIRKKQVSRTPAHPSLWLGFVLLALVGTIAYWNSFDAPLVFDDFLSIQNNQGVRLGLDLVPRLLRSRSLLFTTFSLNYLVAAQDVWGYHLVNLFFHLLNGILLFIIARELLARVWADQRLVYWYAVLAAGFFLVHPVQTESVTYISSRSELMSTFFYLLAFMIFVKVSERHIGFLLSVAISFVAYVGLLTKETVISIPAVLFLYDYLFISKTNFRELFGRWRFYATFVIGGAAVSVYLLLVPLRDAVGSLPGHLSPFSYFLTQLHVIVRYVGLVVFPVRLNLDYDIIPSVSFLEPVVLGSALVLLLLLAAAWILRRREPIVSFSILWFFLTLAPTSSFVPILDVMFEHRLYLPMAGLCFSFPIALDYGVKFLRQRVAIPLKVLPAGVTMLALLTVGTLLRNEVWRDETRLWADVISKSPNKARGYNALAMAHFSRGEYEQGLAAASSGWERLPELDTQFVDTIGNTLLQLGRYEEAAELFGEAARNHAKRDDADMRFVSLEYNNLGVTYQYMWRDLQQERASMSAVNFESEKNRILGSALDAFQSSLDTGAEMFSTFDSYVNVMHTLDRSEEIRAEHDAVLAEEESFRSRYVLAKLAFNDGVDRLSQGDTLAAVIEFEKAVEEFGRATELDASIELMWYNYAYSLERLNRADEAIEKYLRAIEIRPVFVEAHFNVALLYMAREELDTAVEHFEEFLRLFPDDINTNINLAKIYVQMGQRDVARTHLTKALNASPNHPEALSLLQQLGP